MNFSLKREGTATNGNEFDCQKEPGLSPPPSNSIEEKAWKGHLRARWFKNKGSLYWDAGIDAIFDDYAIRDWDELSTRYFKTLDLLKEEGTLRNSFLCKDGDVLHKWSDANNLEVSS